MPRQFQFVAISNPREPVSSELRKWNHSHAIRQAHAEKRRLRTQTYQREVMQNRAEENLERIELDFLSPLNKTLNYGKNLFTALARPLSSQEYFLLDHYVRVVVPYCVMHCGLFDFPGDHQAQVLRDWVGLAITDKDLLDDAVLLSACRHIIRSKPGDQILTQMALQYKQKSLQTLRQAISGGSSQLNILTVAHAFALAFDEEASGEIGTAWQHLQGVFAMAELSGGPQSLGLTGLLEHMYRRFIDMGLLRGRDSYSLCGRRRTVRPVIEAVH